MYGSRCRYKHILVHTVCPTSIVSCHFIRVLRPLPRKTNVIYQGTFLMSRHVNFYDYDMCSRKSLTAFKNSKIFIEIHVMDIP
jgi:hypothetical protein